MKLTCIKVAWVASWKICGDGLVQSKGVRPSSCGGCSSFFARWCSSPSGRAAPMRMRLPMHQWPRVRSPLHRSRHRTRLTKTARIAPASLGRGTQTTPNASRASATWPFPPRRTPSNQRTKAPASICVRPRQRHAAGISLRPSIHQSFSQPKYGRRLPRRPAMRSCNRLCGLMRRSSQCLRFPVADSRCRPQPRA